MFRLCLVLVVVGRVLASKAGPPVDEYPTLCQDMNPSPGHAYSTNMGQAPYAIVTNSATYAAGQVITVTVSSTDNSEFEGIFLQARRQLDGMNRQEAVGVFSNPPSKTKLISCGKPNNAWAQSDEIEATTVNISWNWSCDEGPIAFMATIVKGPKENYWTGVLSSQLTFIGSNSSQCASIAGHTPPAQRGTGPPSVVRTTPSGAQGVFVSVSVVLVGIASLCAIFNI